MHTEDSGEKESEIRPRSGPVVGSSAGASAGASDDSSDESSGGAPRGTFFGLESGGGAEIPAPEAPGQPWCISGVDRLKEGCAWSLFLSRGEGQAVIEIILCRVNGLLSALDSECPHAGGRIQAGELIEGRYARCPLHWFDFNPPDGRCVNVDCPPADTYRVEERDGIAMVWP